MLFTKSSGVFCAFIAAASAHMRLRHPKPFAQPSKGNGPLQPNGSDFPCQQSPGGVYAAGGANVFPLGSQQPLTFTGQAVHGGGSCQVSITYDTAPTKDSVWKVIHSIEGGCPARGEAGNMGDDASAADPYEYAFRIPDNIPTGNATIAWTWFNKIGFREMYMNCAPVSLTGSSGSQSNFDSLPDMFTANIGNGCGTPDSKDVLFPNPGESVEQLNGATNAFIKPTGEGCQKPTGGNGGNKPPPKTTAAPPVAPAPTQKPTPTIPGGVFITVPTAGPTAGEPDAAPTTLRTTTPPAAPPAAPTKQPSPGPGAGSGSGSSGAFTVGSACPSEGQWNCISGSSYQQCGSGLWSPVMQLAAGTKCTPGVSTNINIVASNKKARRHMRFHGHRFSV